MSKHGRPSRGQRDRAPIASPDPLLDPLDRLVMPSPWSPVINPARDDPGPLADLSDGRLWHPSRARPNLTVFSSRARLAPSMRTSEKRPAFFSPVISFARPQTVITCVRRKQRREILFARKRTGAGSKARFRHRNIWSSISCRR